MPAYSSRLLVQRWRWCVSGASRRRHARAPAHPDQLRFSCIPFHALFLFSISISIRSSPGGGWGVAGDGRVLACCGCITIPNFRRPWKPRAISIFYYGSFVFHSFERNASEWSVAWGGSGGGGGDQNFAPGLLQTLGACLLACLLAGLWSPRAGFWNASRRPSNGTISPWRWRRGGRAYKLNTLT